MSNLFYVKVPLQISNLNPPVFVNKCQASIFSTELTEFDAHNGVGEFVYVDNSFSLVDAAFMILQNNNKALNILCPTKFQSKNVNDRTGHSDREHLLNTLE